MTAYIPIHIIDNTYTLGIYQSEVEAKDSIKEWLTTHHPTLVQSYLGEAHIADSLISEDEKDEEFWRSSGLSQGFTIVETAFGELFEFCEYDNWDSNNLYTTLDRLLSSKCLEKADDFIRCHRG